jgi:hypothetical protein
LRLPQDSGPRNSTSGSIPPPIPGDGHPKHRTICRPIRRGKREQCHLELTRLQCVELPDAGKAERQFGIDAEFVALDDNEPRIWRRLIVPLDTTLADMHPIIQAAMGWSDAHLHEFDVGGLTYGDPNRYAGHLRPRLVEFTPSRPAFEIDRPQDRLVEVTFRLGARRFREVQRVVNIIFGLNV